MITVIFVTASVGFLGMLVALSHRDEEGAIIAGLICLLIIVICSGIELKAGESQHPEIQKLQQQLIDAGLATHTPVVTGSKFELLIGEKR